MDRPELFIVHWLHVFLAIYWFGAILFSRVKLFPALRKLGPESLEEVRGALKSGHGTKITYTAAIGTVTLGWIRGFIDGALDDHGSLYGQLYLIAGVLGILMVVYLVSPLYDKPILNVMYVWAFPVMFTMMVMMRFSGLFSA